MLPPSLILYKSRRQYVSPERQQQGRGSISSKVTGIPPRFSPSRGEGGGVVWVVLGNGMGALETVTTIDANMSWLFLLLFSWAAAKGFLLGARAVPGLGNAICAGLRLLPRPRRGANLSFGADE